MTANSLTHNQNDFVFFFTYFVEKKYENLLFTIIQMFAMKQTA